MAGGALRLLVGLDGGPIMIGVGGNGGIERGQIKPSAGSRLGQVIALVPIVHCARPDGVGHRADELQPAPGFRRSNAELRQAVDVRLFRRIKPGRRVHIDRVGLGPAIGHAQKLSLAIRVLHQIEHPQRIDLLEEIRLPHRNRIDDAHVADDVVAGHQIDHARQQQIGVGRTERPEEIEIQAHCGAFVRMFNCPARPA